MRLIQLVSAGAAIAMLGACGAGSLSAPMRPGLAPHHRAKAPLGARTVESPQDLTLLREIGEAAGATQRDIDARYAELGLNTASGRKLRPAREEALTAGLAPLIVEVEARLALWLTRLQADGRYTDLVLDIARRRPLADEALPADADASAMIYRIAQYRLKLGLLIEFAVRQGAVTE